MSRGGAWIEFLDDAQVEAAGGRLARLYRAARDPGQPHVDNILRIHSLRPETLDGHLRLYRAAMRTDIDVDPRERETLAVAVSAANACHY